MLNSSTLPALSRASREMDASAPTRVCNMCQQPKALTSFGRHARSRDGHRRDCLECSRRVRSRGAKRAVAPVAPGQPSTLPHQPVAGDTPFLVQLDRVLHLDPIRRRDQVQAVAKAWKDIAPADGLEAMIATQLIVAHEAAMACYQHIHTAITVDIQHDSLRMANKLSKTCVALLDGLNRHRGKGQQKVTVEHVHVHSGGQAIVGAVDAQGGGVRRISEEQAYVLTTHAPGAPMRSAKESGRLVPGTGDAQRALPAPRRKVNGRSSRKQKRA